MSEIKDKAYFDRYGCPDCCERNSMSEKFIEHLSKRPAIQCTKCGCLILLGDGIVVEPKMEKVFEALERLKTAPSFMGGTVEYRFSTNSQAALLEDYELVKQALLKTQELEKEIEILKEYRKDYLNRLENLEKHSLKQDKALEIIKEKKIDVVNLCCSLDAESYNLSVENLGLNDSYKITQEEFKLLNEVL